MSEDYYQKAYGNLAADQVKIFNEFPEVVDIATSAASRPVRLLCPKGHRVLTVTVKGNQRDGIRVMPAVEGMEAGEVVAKPSDPDDAFRYEKGFNAVDPIRVTLRCPKKGCGYAGVHRQERLLKLYAGAVRLGLGEIRLPA